MNLDDTAYFAKLDSQNLLAQIDCLPGQLQQAYVLGLSLLLPGWLGFRQVLIGGMGGSAIGGDLLAAYASPLCKIPIIVHRDYGLPGWASAEDTLVIVSSHSGNTEETLSVLQSAIEGGCRCLAISTGGELTQIASRAGIPTWTYNHPGPPRAAVGYSFGLMLAVLNRLGLLPDSTDELNSAVQAMKAQQVALTANVPAVHNPAKRYAGQLMGRWVSVIASGLLAPVARRWKTQINELAKAYAQFDFLPEADHNSLEGIFNPETLFGQSMVLFLRSPSDHPRNRLRSDLTRTTYMLEGLNTDFVDAQGNNPLSHLWTCLHFGDYVAYYLAMAYGADPAPVDTLENFKRELATHPGLSR